MERFRRHYFCQRSPFAPCGSAIAGGGGSGGGGAVFPTRGTGDNKTGGGAEEKGENYFTEGRKQWMPGVLTLQMSKHLYGEVIGAL